MNNLRKCKILIICAGLSCGFGYRKRNPWAFLFNFSVRIDFLKMSIFMFIRPMKQRVTFLMVCLWTQKKKKEKISTVPFYSLWEKKSKIIIFVFVYIFSMIISTGQNQITSTERFLAGQPYPPFKFKLSVLCRMFLCTPGNLCTIPLFHIHINWYSLWAIEYQFVLCESSNVYRKHNPWIANPVFWFFKCTNSNSYCQFNLNSYIWVLIIFIKRESKF